MGWQSCADFGVLGWPVATEYGGSVLDPLSTVIALKARGYACRDDGLVLVANNHPERGKDESAFPSIGSATSSLR